MESGSPTSGLSLVGYLFKTTDTIPVALWNLFQFQTFQVKNLRTSVTADHFTILTTDLALVFTLGLFFFLFILFGLILILLVKV